MKRYALVFAVPTVLFGAHIHYDGSPRKTRMATRTAKGPIAAYRKATGWKGKVFRTQGYSNQCPIAKVAAYVPFTTAKKHAEAMFNAPSVAYVVPIGEW